MGNYKNIIFKDLFTNECRFKESVFENYWCLYSSIQYKHPETKVRIYRNRQKLYFSVQMLKIIQRPWHLGINSKGKCIKGMRAKKDRTASHFLPRPIEGTIYYTQGWKCRKNPSSALPPLTILYSLYSIVTILVGFLLIHSAIMMREPYEADDMMARSIQPTRSNSFNNDSEDLRMLP